MANPIFLGDGHTPRRSDTKWTILQKILGVEIDGGGGGTGTFIQQVYVDRDPLPPDNQAYPALNYKSTTGVITQWAGASWV